MGNTPANFQLVNLLFHIDFYFKATTVLKNCLTQLPTWLYSTCRLFFFQLYTAVKMQTVSDEGRPCAFTDWTEKCFSNRSFCKDAVKLQAGLSAFLLNAKG